jgi:broad specificity phosphatase PhoE
MIQSTQVLWLVRHGESTWNTLGLAQGHCDQARLTRLGQRQAWAVAAQLRDRPVAALYASDLRRALETAAPLAEVTGLSVHRDTRLRERCLGVLEGAATTAIGPAANGLCGDQVVEPDARPEGGSPCASSIGVSPDLPTNSRPGVARWMPNGPRRSPSSRTAARSGC